jgi:hypothetical protein
MWSSRSSLTIYRNIVPLSTGLNSKPTSREQEDLVPGYFFGPSLTMKMEAVLSSELSDFCMSTQYYILEDNLFKKIYIICLPL